MALQRGIWLELYAAFQLLGSVIARTLPQDQAAREFAVYSTLYGLEQATPTQLAGVLGLPLTTASAQLRRLVTRGHATRTINPDDGRSYVFSLTDEGRRVTAAHFESFGRMAQRVRARLTMPEADIRAGLVALETALRDELEAVEPRDAS